MRHAWKGYKDYAWGSDELKPLSMTGRQTLGKTSLCLTMIDALDTLFLMNMREEFWEAAEYVFSNTSFNITSPVSMFEANIRIVGGLLSAYALTKDQRFADRALNMGERFLVNFAHESFPRNTVNLSKLSLYTKEDLRKSEHIPQPKKDYGYADYEETIKSLAQLGTLSLEFGYLSEISGDPIFRDRAVKIIERLDKIERQIPGLLPNQIIPSKLTQPFSKHSIGSEADSFYEYLLKYWLFTGKQDKLHHRMYKEAVEGIRKFLVADVEGKKYIVSNNVDDKIMQMDHLACFAPGMLALGAINEGDDELLELAAELTESCYLMYHNQGSQILIFPFRISSLI